MLKCDVWRPPIGVTYPPAEDDPWRSEEPKPVEPVEPAPVGDEVAP